MIKKIKENMYARLAFGIIIVIIMLVLCSIVHEFSHLLASEFLGLETLGISLEQGYLKANVLYDEYLMKKRIFLVSGSLGGIFFSYLLIKIGKEKKSLTLTITGLTHIIEEIVYWILSPVIKNGDFYMLLQTYPNAKLYVWYTMLIIFLIAISIFAYYKIKNIYDIKRIEEIKKKYCNEDKKKDLLKEYDFLQVYEKDKLLN
jgi:hypothetical protein